MAIVMCYLFSKNKGKVNVLYKIVKVVVIDFVICVKKTIYRYCDTTSVNMKFVRRKGNKKIIKCSNDCMVIRVLDSIVSIRNFKKEKYLYMHYLDYMQRDHLVQH